MAGQGGMTPAMPWYVFGDIELQRRVKSRSVKWLAVLAQEVGQSNIPSQATL